MSDPQIRRHIARHCTASLLLLAAALALLLWAGNRLLASPVAVSTLLAAGVFLGTGGLAGALLLYTARNLDGISETCAVAGVLPFVLFAAAAVMLILYLNI